MAAPKISSQNDFALDVFVPKPKSSARGTEGATGLTISGFLSTTNTSTSAAADASLIPTVTELSGGWYRVVIDASVLTQSLMNTHFSGTTPYLFLTSSNNFRRSIELDYDDQLAATVV